MAVTQSSEALRRPLNLLRLGFCVLAMTAVVLGYVGMAAFVRQSSEWGDRPIDVVYYDLQLFVLGADPLQESGPYPWQLECARFLVPSVTLYALIETARVLLAVELSRLRARRSRGHAIVCGDGLISDALSRQLQAEAVPVIDIRSTGDEFVTRGEPLRIIGDARDPKILLAAGAHQARALYACTSSGAQNAAIAFSAERLRGKQHHPFSVHGHVPDQDLLATLQATALGRNHRDGVHVAFFNIDQIAARRLFADDPVLPIRLGAPHLVIVHVCTFAAAVLVAAARSWRVNRPDEGKLPVTMFGPGASAMAAEQVRRYPFVGDVCEVVTDEVDLLDLITDGRTPPAPSRLVICSEDDELGLKTATLAQRLWSRSSFPTTLRWEGLAAFPCDSLAAVGGNFALTDRKGLRVFGVISSACDPVLIRDGLVEQLAQVIHDRYRQGRRRRGEWVDGDPALESWDRLLPTLQQASREQARGIGGTLSRAGCTIAPRIGLDDEAALSPEDFEQLAEYEHQRWCRERAQAGWQYAPERSDESRLHPGLRSWSTLPEPFRQRTRRAVLELSDILQDAGFRIVQR